MFCSKCGKEAEDGLAYCPHCGASLDPASQQKQQNNNNNCQTIYAIRDKNEGIALILSLLVPGIGQMYVGKILRGFVFLFSGIIVAIIMTAAIIAMGAISSADNAIIGAIALSGITVIAYLAIWIYGMYDAYSLAKEYNEYVFANHQKPW
ncbi:MAG: zinc ribbon domain-containing protein [Candidatus Cloacimonetes bacterium]|nr:zinc ribbon domain-containing protein [Candidatus Cloacimonadota bacterium]